MPKIDKSLREVYPVGTRVTATVDRIEPFGVFVRLTDNSTVVGLIRPREWSWKRQTVDFRPEVESGDEITAEVLGHARAGVNLSRKAVLENPFPAFRRRHKVGQAVEGEVVLVARGSAGVKVRLDDGVQGFVPRSEIPDYGQHQEGFGLLAEDWIQARILRFEDQRQEVVLSIRELLSRRERSRRTRVSAKTPTLHHHPSVGPALEEISLNLRLQGYSSPEVTPAVRNAFSRILVVEDDAGVSESLEIYLQLLGFNCVSAKSVNQAKNLLSKGSFDLVILDVNMPGGKGLELLRTLDTGHPPCVLVVTGAPTADWEQLITKAGDLVSGIFQKPTRLEDLLAFLTDLVAGKHPQDDRSLEAGFETSEINLTGRQISNDRSRQARISWCLEALRRRAGASRAFVLSYQPGPRFQLKAGSLPDLTLDVQQKLDFSPIGNTIRRRESMLVQHVSKNTALFQHLLDVIPVGAFAGEALPYRDRAEYGLFLVSEQEGQLSISQEHLSQAAIEIGQYLAEERLDEVITENQILLLTGFLADSLLHEIRNSADALSHASGVQLLLAQKYTTDLGEMSGEEMVRFKKAIVRVKDESQEIAQVIELFRNLAGQSQEEEISLERTIERLIRAVAPLAEDKSVYVETNFAPEMPDLHVVPRLLEQPLLNMMINAIEQMALAGTQDRVLRISTRFAADEHLPVVITLLDTGPGVHRVHLARIFDLFFTTKPRGTGLGLYLSRYFIERLGGRIRPIKSVMFLGTEFVVELPAEVLA